MSKKSSKHIVYVTKRMLAARASKAIEDASEKAMEVAGYLIRVEEGWLVRENEDGTIERIKKLKANSDQPIALD